MKRYLTIITVICLSLPAIAQEAGYTDWSDQAGEHTIRAEFVSFDGQNVTLKQPNGEIVEIAIAELSATDAERARNLAKSNSSPAIPPPPPPASTSSDSGESEMFLDREFTDLEKEQFQSRLDSMETPGKTAAWPHTWFFYGMVAAINEARAGDGPDGPGVYKIRDSPSGKRTVKPLSPMRLPIPESLSYDFVGPAIWVLSFLGIVVTSLWLLVRMFRTHVGWGCSFLLFSWIIALVYLFTNWHAAKAPLAWHIFFSLTFLLSLFIYPEWSVERLVLEEALELVGP